MEWFLIIFGLMCIGGPLWVLYREANTDELESWAAGLTYNKLQIFRGMIFSGAAFVIIGAALATLI